jgi:ubiquinone/menaquinone biosynthesis C-methylase UbiE
VQHHERARRLSISVSPYIYWLAPLRTVSPRIYGLDYSLDMLRKASDRDPTIRLVRATAEVIPFHSGTFDLTFCINAIHHFERIEQFIA